jgi:uncharacterized protein YegP (UPF0339 family)
MKPKIKSDNTRPVLRVQKFSELSLGWNKRLYYFRIRAANSEIVLQSEAYTTARARNNTVELILSAAILEEHK